MKKRNGKKNEEIFFQEVFPTRSIDIHGMTVMEAKNYLDMGINLLPKQVKLIAIIHGYQSGTRLKTMVQKEYVHPRLKQKLFTTNQGQTIFILS